MTLSARLPGAAAALFLFFLVPDAALADAQRGTLSLTVENDVVSGQDRHYTSGVRAAWVTAPVRPNRLERRLAANPAEPATIRRSFAVGQSIYTPEDIEADVPAEGDHPYTGYLFGEAAILSERNGRWDLFTLEAGVVGPAAQAEEAQNWIHHNWGFVEARGWDSQLDNEAVMTLAYDWKGRPLVEGRAGAVDWELTPAAGASVGSLAVNARAGGMLRIGSDLQPDFGPARIRPSLTGTGHYADRGLGWYAFVGGQGRAVAHDLFLDGSLFQDSPSVQKEPFVGDLQAGAAVTFGRTQISWTYVHRTRRFETQQEADAFGALSLGFKL